MNTATSTNRRNGTASQAARKAPASVEVKPHLIRRRAYEIFLSRNGGPGDHVSDWIQAELELNGASQVAPTAGRNGERRGREGRLEVTSQPICDGILDNR